MNARFITVAFLAGAIFGVGLILSGMTQPAKVINFLDFLGNWDASLAFVMGGAILVYFPVFRIVRGRTPVLAKKFMMPTSKSIDWKLVVGAGLFGIGWGIGGFCPGPALTSLGSGLVDAFIFVGAMLAGMGLHAITLGRRG